MNKFFLLLICLLIVSLSIPLAGCSTGSLSEEEAGDAILFYLTRSATSATETTSRNVEAVEVIEIKEFYEQGRMKIWPVSVKILKSGFANEEFGEFHLFKDVMGSVKVLRRTL
jgi:hypothetical protein